MLAALVGWPLAGDEIEARLGERLELSKRGKREACLDALPARHVETLIRGPAPTVGPVPAGMVPPDPPDLAERDALRGVAVHEHREAPAKEVEILDAAALELREERDERGRLVRPAEGTEAVPTTGFEDAPDFPVELPRARQAAHRGVAAVTHHHVDTPRGQRETAPVRAHDVGLLWEPGAGPDMLHHALRAIDSKESGPLGPSHGRDPRRDP